MVNEERGVLLASSPDSTAYYRSDYKRSGGSNVARRTPGVDVM